MLGDLHPKLLARLGSRRLVGVVPRHVSVVDLKRLLDSFRVGVHHAVQDDLGLLDHVYLLAVVPVVLILLSFQLLNLALAHIDRVVDFKKDRLALLLVGFFLLEPLDQILEVFAMNVEVEGHVVDGLGGGPLDLDAVLGEEVARRFIGPVWDLVHGGH